MTLPPPGIELGPHRWQRRILTHRMRESVLVRLFYNIRSMDLLVLFRRRDVEIAFSIVRVFGSTNHPEYVPALCTHRPSLLPMDFSVS